MAGGCSGAVLIAVTAAGAGMGGVAGGGAGGLRHRCLIAVARGGNCFRLGVCTGAAGIGSGSGSGAGGLLGHRAAAPAMGTGGTADTAHTVTPAVRAGRAANGTFTAGPAVAHQLVTGIANAVGAVVQMLTAGGIHAVAQGQGTVAVDLQRKGDLCATGDKHLLRRAGAGVVEGSGGIGNIGLRHVPVGVIAGLDAHIAVAGEGSRQLSVDKLVGAHIGGIFLTGIILAIDEAKEIVFHNIGIGTPASVAIIPCAGGYRVAVFAVGGNGQVGALIPLVVPVICRGAGIHSAENHIAVARRYCGFVNAVTVGIRHTDPGIP